MGALLTIYFAERDYNSWERKGYECSILKWCHVAHALPLQNLSFDTIVLTNGDVSWLLRRCGLSASMFLTHDLRIITKNPRVELNHIQKQLLKEIGNSL